MSQPPPPADHSRHQAVATTASYAAVVISSQLMIAAVVFLFMVVVFIFFIYLYVKHYMGSSPALRRSRARFIFAAAADQVPASRRGLAEEVLKTLPVKVYTSSQFKDGLECAVCLSELSEGEEARILPKCRHGFHVQCIDMWFHSHSTCPLCRAPVTGEAEAAEVQPAPAAEQSPVFPTNVLFWGNQDRVSNGVSSQEGSSGSSSGSKKPEGMLVIDIPRRAMEDVASPLPTSRFAGEEMKSPVEEAKTPKSARLRSLRRLLSRGKMVIGGGGGGSCSPRGGDIEQGVGVIGEGSSK